MNDYNLIRRGDALDCFMGLDRIRDIMDCIAALLAVTQSAPDAANRIEGLKADRKKTYEALLKVTRIHDEVEAKLENLLGGAETVLEAWDRGDEASFREAIEEMRADVEEAKGGKDD